MARTGLGVLAGVGVVAATALLVSEVQVSEQRPELMPPPMPTEIVDETLADRKLRSAGRKAWNRERHKARPGVDWKQVEAERGRRRMAERQRLREEGFRSADGTWTERGSNNQAGRMHHAQVTSDGVLYAGSNLGGLWKGNLDGDAWEPIGDDLYGGVHELAVIEREPGTEDDILIVANGSYYFYRSEDGGETWEEVGSEFPSDPFWMKQIVQTTDDPDNPKLFLILASYTNQTELYRSDDLGETWSAVANMGWYYGDVWTPRDGSEGVWMLGDSAGAGYVYWSEDDGTTWTRVGQVGSYSTRGYLAGSEAGALYATIQNSSGYYQIYRSEDWGENWAYRSTAAEFWGQFAASRIDKNMVVFGGVEVYVSTDGGSSATKVNEWYDYYDRVEDRLHADLFGLDVLDDGDGTETWLIGTDGGLYKSTDQLNTVENLSLMELRVSQYYGTLTDKDDHDAMAAGSQDQGYQINTTMEQDDDQWEFEQTISGDYAHLTSGDGSLDIVYSVYPASGGYAGWAYIQLGADGDEFTYHYLPATSEIGSGSWLNPVVADPDDPEVFYSLGAHIYAATRTSYWYWENAKYSDEDFEYYDGEYASIMRFAPTDTDRVYLATNYGRIYWSDDHGVTWTESADLGPYAQYFYGSAMAVSRTDADVAYLGGSGYSGVPSLLRTTDGGETWDDFSDGIGDTLVYGIVEADDGSGVLFAATQQAAYRRDPGASEWTDITGTDAPITTYWSVEALHGASTVRFGTYGRGIWDYSWTGSVGETDTEEPSDTEDTDTEVPSDDQPTDTDAPTDDTDDADDTDDTEEDQEIEAGSCGCAAGGAAGGFWVAPLVLFALRRRRT